MRVDDPSEEGINRGVPRSTSNRTAAATIRPPVSEGSLERNVAMRSATLAWLANSVPMSKASATDCARDVTGGMLESKSRDLSTAVRTASRKTVVVPPQDPDGRGLQALPKAS
jgi:hypothetical protein